MQGIPVPALIPDPMCHLLSRSAARRTDQQDAGHWRPHRGCEPLDRIGLSCELLSKGTSLLSAILDDALDFVKVPLYKKKTMTRAAIQSGKSRTRRAIVKLLKTEGAVDAAQVAARLGLTAMAVRQHLYQLQRERWVTAEERPVPLGRPAKYWQLTREADRLFPDAYAEVSVALIEAVGDAFVEAGLKQVLESRLAKQRANYSKRIPPSLSLKEKVQGLARIRSEEGYM